MVRRTGWVVVVMFVLIPVRALSQDATKTNYRSGYQGVCRASVRFPDSPPFRYWCRVPNGRAIQIPIEPAHIDVLTRVSVCALERLTRREDDAPCGFPGATLLWSGQPTRSVEMSNPGISFGDPLEEPDDMYIAVELNWDGTFPEEGNLFSIGYASLSRALREMKVRLEGTPNAATLTPTDTTIRIGEAGQVKLLAARKSQNAIWLERGEAVLVGGGRTYPLRLGVARNVPAGDYEIRTNGYLPEGTGRGFLEIEAEYETGP